MATVDHAARRIQAKVVYWGPHGSGKTANLTYVLEKTRGGETLPKRTPAPGEATYDVVPMTIGEIRGYSTHLALVAVSGHPSFGAHRLEQLANVDGLVFVADARAERAQATLESLAELRASLARHGFALERLPLVIQANLRDQPTSATAAAVATGLGLPNVRAFDAIAPRGVGVFDTLKAVTKLVLTELRKG